MAEQPAGMKMDALGDLALQAGAAIMRHFGKAEASIKSDGSPVTLADAEAEAIIVPGLAKICPDIPVIAEEASARGDIPDVHSEFFLVDPLDGTKEFLAGNTDFTVNIGLVQNGHPVAGVIFAPATGRLWLGCCEPLAIASCETCDAEPGSVMADVQNRRSVRVRPLPDNGLIVAASRSHLTPQTDAYIAALPIATRRNAGSSLKFCLIAEGKADVYPRFGPTMEWDTCAGHAILQAAGGSVQDGGGGPFLYGKQAQGYRNGDFIAASDFEGLARLRAPASR